MIIYIKSHTHKNEKFFTSTQALEYYFFKPFPGLYKEIFLFNIQSDIKLDIDKLSTDL